jgi:hypothetical protein
MAAASDGGSGNAAGRTLLIRVEFTPSHVREDVLYWPESGDKQRFSALLVHSGLFGRLDRVNQVGCNDLRCLGKPTGYPNRSQDWLALYESVGRKFESCRAHQLNQGVTDFGLWLLLFFSNLFLTRIVSSSDFR